MVLDLALDAQVTIDGRRYTVEELTSLHDMEFRLDLVRLHGPTPAHERWLLAVLLEPHLMLVHRLEQDWLAPPLTTISHEGEIFANLYRGSANRARRSTAGRSKDTRVDYALFRADSGRVILMIGRNDEYETWIGATLPSDAISLPKTR